MTDTKHTVLLVEDEAPAALVLGNTLKQEGFEVFLAANGREGLSMAIEHHPDVIIADVIMPEMTGLEMIEELRKDSWGKDAQILILSNLSDVSTVEEAMKHHAFNYMVKGDSKMSKVIEKVRELLK